MAEEAKQKKKKNKKRTICAVIIVFMMICFWFIVFLLLFQVRKINVKGNEFLTKQAVEEWVEEDELATNSVYLLWKFHFTDYEKLPAIENVKVTISNPWTVNVKVNEKRIVGCIVVNDQYVYFDEDGLVLEKTHKKRENIPGIEGINVNQADLYKELPVSKGYKKVFSNLLEMNTSLQKYGLKPDRIVCENEDIRLYFENKCVLLGNRNFAVKIAQIPPIFEKLGDKSGVLHLDRFSDVNTTISFTEEEPDKIQSEDETGEKVSGEEIDKEEEGQPSEGQLSETSTKQPEEQSQEQTDSEN